MIYSLPRSSCDADTGTYSVSVNKRLIFHVNMLKQFHSPIAVNSNFLVDETGQASVESELLDVEIPSWNSHHNGNPKTGEQL